MKLRTSLLYFHCSHLYIRRR